MNNQSNRLSTKISPDRLAIFMRKAVDELTRDYSRLDELIQDECWPEASKLAHKLKSVVTLLDLDSHLPSLRAIEAMELSKISQPEFQEHFRNQYQAGIQKVSQSVN